MQSKCIFSMAPSGLQPGKCLCWLKMRGIFVDANDLELLISSLMVKVGSFLYLLVVPIIFN